jgi:hypothetical protein
MLAVGDQNYPNLEVKWSVPHFTIWHECFLSIKGSDRDPSVDWMGCLIGPTAARRRFSGGKSKWTFQMPQTGNRKLLLMT